MSDQILRLQAAMAEVVRQRDEAQARCANMAGDLAAQASELEGLRARCAGLEKVAEAKKAEASAPE